MAALGGGALKMVMPKRVDFDEYCRLLELDGAQEAELRRMFEDYEEKLLKLLSGGDPAVEDELRRQVEAARDDPDALEELKKSVSRRLMKVMTESPADFMALQAERYKKIRSVLDERQRKKARDYVPRSPTGNPLGRLGGGGMFSATVIGDTGDSGGKDK